MNRHPADAYVGLPWLPGGDSHEGLSCWGLVVLYYREQMGVTLSNFQHAYDDIEVIRAEIEAALGSGAWQLHAAPEEGDVVTLSRRDAPHHLGVFAAGRVLHITEQTQQVVAQTPAQLTAARWGRIRYWGRV